MVKKKTSVTTNAVLNVLKTFTSIVFPLITFPYVTRVLGAVSYGKYSFSASIISYIVLIAGLGIGTYATREGNRLREDKEKLKQFINEVYTLNVCSTLFSFIILIFLIAFWTKITPYTSIILILSIQVIATLLGTEWINLIFEEFKFITIRYLICQAISLVFLLVFVKSSEDILLYAMMSVLTNVLASSANFIYIRKHDIHPSVVLNKNVFRHIKPVLLLFSYTVVSMIYINSDITILGILKNDYDVGIYTASSKIFSILKQIVGAAVVVVIPRVSLWIEQGEQQKISTIVNKLSEAIFLFCIPVVIGLFLLSDDITLLVAGQEYSASALPLRILSLAFFFAGFGNVLVNGVLIPFRREKFVLVVTTTSALINIVLNIIFIPNFSYDAAATTTLISEMFVCIICYIYANKIIRIRICNPILNSIVGGIIAAIICTLCRSFIYSYLLRILIAVISSILLYYLFLILRRNNIVYEFSQKIYHKLFL